jgi:AmmeMemoRadiSam system protein B
MKIRENSLPGGWYPRDKAEISRFLGGFQQGTALAAVAPHAGWYYSGKIAAGAVSSLDKNVETVAIIGGHLPAGYPPLYAEEDAVSTPFGDVAIDGELRAAVKGETGGVPDNYRDNTVEVLVPMVRFFIPSAHLLWLRLPSEMSSFEAGKAIAAAAKKLGRRVAVLASTDLTHYGPNYGFTPKGTGPAALRWVEEVNDKGFIEAVLSGDPAAVLERAETDRSSCSAGAVVGAMGFGGAAGLGPARLIEYGTSAGVSDKDVPDDFVGYAGFQMRNEK